MSEYILGIHFGHDATAVLLKDGVIVEAMSEERLSRIKKYTGYPKLSIDYIKKKYNVSTFDLIVADGLEFGGHIFETLESNRAYRENTEKPDYFIRGMGARYSLLAEIYRLFDILRFSKNIINGEAKTRAFLEKEFPGNRIEFIHHHLAHAYATVPFYDDFKKKKIILTLDGQGDDLSGSINLCENGEIKVLHTIKRENSIGLLYASVVDILGMQRNEHEFKVMGLAPYAKQSSGEKVYKKLKELIWFDEEEMTIKSKIDMRRATGYLIANNYFVYRFDSLAYGVQKLTEEIIKSMARAAIKKYGCSDLAIGGGVFMNVKANQYLFEMPEITSLSVTPSCGDESLAIGNVVYGYSLLHKNLEGFSKVDHLYLGSEYSDAEVKKAIDDNLFTKSCTVSYFDPESSHTIEHEVAKILSENSVVGRLSGRAEWGARALGNRSILANPMSRDNVKLINEMIKNRDFWMPFATSLLYEAREEYLVNPKDLYAPFMAITFETKEKAHKELAAALHPYDLTSRPQMVKKEVNQKYHTLISHFKSITGSGGVLNTSFNLHGEPNVETPDDALRTFEHSGLPHVAIGNYLVSKKTISNKN